MAGSNSVLACQSADELHIVTAVADRLYERGTRRADRHARRIVPPVLEYLSLYPPVVIAGPLARAEIRSHCLTHVRRSFGPIGWLLVRMIAIQVVEWLVEWFFSGNSLAWRSAVQSRLRGA